MTRCSAMSRDLAGRPAPEIGAIGRSVLRSGRLAILGLLALLWPANLAAQPVTVIGGEHPAFTRIVLQSAAPFAWTAQESRDRVVITLSEDRLSLDSARVFQRIPRTRLTDLNRQGGRLVLQLACACPVRIVEDGSAVLIVDISDPVPDTAAGPAPHSEETARLRRHLDALPRQAAQRAGAALAAELTLSEQFRGFTTEAGTPPLPEGPGAQATPIEEPGATPNAIGPPAGTAVETLPEGLAEALIEALTEAIDSGLIDPASGVDRASLTRPEAPMPQPAALPTNLRLRIASDPQTTAADSHDPPGVDCPDPAATAFLTAPLTEPFATALGRLNRRLYGEFDQPDADSALALVRHYLAWGLGAEARLVLVNDQEFAVERDLLLGVADVIEHRHSNARQRLAGKLDCPGATALLAALAAAPVTQIHSQDDALSDRLLAAFLITPPGLRAALGPQLVELFLAADALDPARRALEALERGELLARTELERLTAQIDVARGDAERAAQRLDARATQDAAALALRLEIATSRNETLEPDRLEDAAVLAAAERGTEPGRRLAEAVVLQHALAGRASAGFAVFDRFAAWLEPSRSADLRLAPLRARLWASALELPDDAFLSLVLTRRDWLDPRLDPSLASNLAARLASLGLGSLASQIQARPPLDGAAGQAEPGGPPARADTTRTNGLSPAPAAAPPLPSPATPEHQTEGPASLPGAASAPARPDRTHPDTTRADTTRAETDDVQIAAAMDIPGNAGTAGEAPQQAATQPDPMPVSPMPDAPTPQPSLPQDPAPQSPAPQSPAPQGPASQGPASQNPAQQDPEPQVPEPAPAEATDPMARSAAALSASEALRAQIAGQGLALP